MSSIVIQVKSQRNNADLTNRYQPDTSAPKHAARALHNLFGAILGGAENASVTVYTNGTDPASATGTVTLTYASIAANDTVTIAGTALTCSSSTTDATHFKKVTDGPTTAANLATCINSNTTLNQFVSASAASGVVTITSLVSGAIGNTLTLATSNGTGFALSGSTMSGGAGGIGAAGVSYALGL